VLIDNHSRSPWLSEMHLTNNKTTATLVTVKTIGDERDEYLLLGNRELRDGATQQSVRREIHPRASAISANGSPR